MADEPKTDDQQPASGTASPPSAEQSAPEDALGKTDEENGQDAADAAAAGAASGAPKPEAPKVKKPNAFKAFYKKVNIYLLGFILVIIIVGAVGTVSYLNSRKTPKAPSTASQKLDQATLKKLANSSATVGNAAQTLTVQGNAIFDGQVLVRSDLNVAGSIQLGGSLLAPSLTVSGNSNLGATQINSLQVATNVEVQGSETISKDLDVAGNTSLSGSVTASRLTVTTLILTGNAALQVPNHLGFPGASPGRTTSQPALGAGGTASVRGSDTTGSININTGNNPVVGCFITLRFNKPYTSIPHVLISPFGSGAGSLDYYVDRSNIGFSVCSNNAAPSHRVFGFDYFTTS